MEEVKIVIEEYNGIKLKTKWDENKDILFIDFSDVFNLLCNYEKEFFSIIKHTLIKDLIKLKQYEDEDKDYNDLINNNFEGLFISLNSIMGFLESFNYDEINDLKLWFTSIIFKYKKKRCFICDLKSMC